CTIIGAFMNCITCRFCPIAGFCESIINRVSKWIQGLDDDFPYYFPTIWPVISKFPDHDSRSLTFTGGFEYQVMKHFGQLGFLRKFLNFLIELDRVILGSVFL